ncbi:MAG: radical SAM protein [bacterium]
MTNKTKPIGIYNNGNVIVTILQDGTKIRYTQDDEFKPEFSESCDLKITNRCDLGCSYCHEDSTPNGKHADILNEKFLDTLKPFTELAIGGGNVLEHDDLIKFLEVLKTKNIIANITINQAHFVKDKDKIRYLVDNKLIYGLGISLNSLDTNFISKIKEYDNLVLHVINGVINKNDIDTLINTRDLKILILGYKELRRGEKYLKSNSVKIIDNQEYLLDNLDKLISSCRVVSFDNLSLEQLDIKSKLPEQLWERIYMGDDGTSTFYIDAVEREFAKSSTSNKRYVLEDCIVEMFNKILNET